MPETATLEQAGLRFGPARGWIWAFHLVVAGMASVVLVSLSYPGSNFFLLAASAFGSLCLAGFWLGWTIYVADRTGRRWRWFLAAPAIGALTVVLLLTSAPLELRWAASRGAFAAVVAGQPIPPAGSEWTKLAVPDTLGSYSITRAHWVPGGAVFDEARGNFIETAGFAYLPAGPTEELSDSWPGYPRFHHLGGGWYSWSAGW